MTDSLKGMKRTDYCANFNTENIGQEITVFGWVQRQRDLGILIFIDLRDRTGIIQLSFNDKTNSSTFLLLICFNTSGLFVINFLSFFISIFL